jgi:23S rRNA A1618 N6-methylase RlmF
VTVTSTSASVQSDTRNAHFKNDNPNVVSPKEQLAISTLKLFCTLLDYYNEQIFFNLIGRNLTKEMYNVIETAERVKLERYTLVQSQTQTTIIQWTLLSLSLSMEMRILD